MPKNMTDAFGFEIVTNSFWVPEEVGEVLQAVVIGFEKVETVHGEADAAIVLNFDTREETQVIIGGGLQPLLKVEPHTLVRITFEGEKENPNPKKGRSKVFKSYQFEVARKWDEKAYQAWVLA
jgi:hypothetical protein